MNKHELLVSHHIKSGGIRVCLKPKIPFVITYTLAKEIRKFQNTLVDQYINKPWDGILCVLWYLHSGKITWKGLDFSYINQTLADNNIEGLEQYIEDIFNILFINYLNLDLPLINCSIINRESKGFSREFFFINKISFIKRSSNIHSKYDEDNFKEILNLKDELKKTEFPMEIYIRNKFYSFAKINLKEMGSKLNQIIYEPNSASDKLKYKQIFEEMKEKLIRKIYTLSENNPRTIERLAKIQASEHAQYKLI